MENGHHPLHPDNTQEGSELDAAKLHPDNTQEGSELDAAKKAGGAQAPPGDWETVVVRIGSGQRPPYFADGLGCEGAPISTFFTSLGFSIEASPPPKLLVHALAAACRGEDELASHAQPHDLMHPRRTTVPQSLGGRGAFGGGIFSSFVSVRGAPPLGFEDVQPLVNPRKLIRSAIASHSLTLVVIHSSFC
jgi:hypothetical protein